MPGGIDQAEALLAAGNAEGAVALLRRRVAASPSDARAQALLGAALLSARRPEQAEYALARAAALAPHLAEVHLEHSAALLALGRPAEAEAACRRALEVRGDLAPVWCNLGVALANQHRAEEAESALRRALALAAPAVHVPALTSLAQVLCRAARAEEAMDLLAEAARRDPSLEGDVSFLAMRAFAGNYDPRVSPPLRRAHHEALGAAVSATAGEVRRRVERARRTHPPLPPGDDAPLRLAVLSPDLHDHPVASFAEPIFEHAAAHGLHLIVFETGGRVDAVTRRLRAAAHAWHEAAAMDDAELAEAVAASAPHALLDLSGNTAGARWAVLAARPAPLLVSGIGSPATTGLPQVDARLADAVVDPPGSEAHYTERRLLRLDPCFLCYRPHEQAATTRRAGPTDAGGVVFGSFNNPSKLSGECLSLWARVLAAVPGARLRLKAAGLDDPGTGRRLRARLEAAGVSPARVDLVGFRPGVREHLGEYAHVDIALDTLPYTGTTTTCEALDHGVPVVTLEGSVHAGRVGASLLRAAGLGALVAPDPDRYVRIAASLAQDRARLAAWRGEGPGGLRAILRGSALCDGPAYVRRLVEALRGAVREAWSKVGVTP
jgi:protein O-GlcNAc transferase